jgi:hypothetical protein
MRRKSAVILVFLAMCLLWQAARVHAQPRYWIALNFRLTFNPDGTVIVDQKLHPFTIDGKSLLDDPDVARDMNQSLPRMIDYTLLMFSDNPRLLRFWVLKALEKRYGETVLCDVTGTGKMQQFPGAYIVSVRVWLNTSNYVRQINGSIFEVKVRDSFTSTDPRSWIDVLEVFLNGTKLLNYRWEPPYSHGPQNTLGGLTWINHNEQEAPDFYVFQLVIPGLIKVGEPPEVRAVIRTAEVLGDGLHVVVENTGATSGYVYVWVHSTPDQARKAYLYVNERVELVFPDVRNAPVDVELYSGDALLDRATATRRQGLTVPPYWRPHIVIAIAFAAAALMVAAVLLYRRREIRLKAKRARTLIPALLVAASLRPQCCCGGAPGSWGPPVAGVHPLLGPARWSPLGGLEAVRLSPRGTGWLVAH